MVGYPTLSRCLVLRQEGRSHPQKRIFLLDPEDGASDGGGGGADEAMAGAVGEEGARAAAAMDVGWDRHGESTAWGQGRRRPK